MASRPGPGSGTNQETEAADDFVLSAPMIVGSATFVGLLPLGAPVSSIQQVRVEIYRVFPADSNLGRTITVPTRSNSPADLAFDQRDSVGGSLTFSATVQNSSVTALNSVDSGIHPMPGQTTGGDGAVTGEEVAFNVTFAPPFTLPADHYFFVPQVLLSSGHFLWLSAPKPIFDGTPFLPDLQTWIRNAGLDPDWLRVGTDVVGGPTPPTFNGSFSLSAGTATPETPSPTPGTQPPIPIGPAAGIKQCKKKFPKGPKRKKCIRRAKRRAGVSR